MNNLAPGLPLLTAAIATLTRAGWRITDCIYGGHTAIHPDRQQRLDAQSVADLIELADKEAAKTEQGPR